MRLIYSVLLFWCWLSVSYAASETVEFTLAIQQQRYDNLTQQLRCLVCQNQTIADSNAPLAQDLRHEVAQLINEDYTDTQIIDYLTQRYGQFILYKPLLSQQTLLLWFGPFLLLALAFMILVRVIVKRKKAIQRTEV